MKYGDAFFDAQRDISRASAAAVLPVAWEIVYPESVVDLGCGVGTWLTVAADLGATILGLDGAYVRAEQLLIPSPDFMPVDLESALPNVKRHDLALCLEVFEHLTPEAGSRAVRWLTEVAPVVLFSAAVPGQGGDHHINEQWLSHWATMFAERGYAAIDAIRPRIWQDQRIAFYYRQNIMLFVEDGHPLRAKYPLAPIIDILHPEFITKRLAHFRRLEARSINGRLRQIRAFIRRA